jgi:unsaturated rhamnogalacturonyl hydrolase
MQSIRRIVHGRLLFTCLILVNFPSAGAQSGFTGSRSGPVVLLDNYFNYELHKKTGKVYHYTWGDTENSGFSGWGKIFSGEGFDTLTLTSAPTKKNLKAAAVYIIADPDDTRESPNPHFIDQSSIRTIDQWVKKGGILVMMANDSGNCEFNHFNQLASAFGFQFNEVRRNVPGAGNANMEKASFRSFPDHPFFKDVKAVFIKEICTLSLEDSSHAIFSEGGDDLMAVIPHGEGKVVVIPDPWFYNEYLNGEARCRLTDEYQNATVAKNIARWLMAQSTR